MVELQPHWFLYLQVAKMLAHGYLPVNTLLEGSYPLVGSIPHLVPFTGSSVAAAMGELRIPVMLSILTQCLHRI
jgi:hypothetical protein